MIERDLPLMDIRIKINKWEKSIRGRLIMCKGHVRINKTEYPIQYMFNCV